MDHTLASYFIIAAVWIGMEHRECICGVLQITLVFLLCFLKQTCDAGQICASCIDTDGQDTCTSHIECADEEVCFVHHYTTESGSSSYDLGCIMPEACSQYTDAIIGKRSEVHHIKCSSCCNDTHLCNINVSCHTSSGTPLPRDCSEITDRRQQHTGSHTIYPFGVQNRPVYVHCEFDVYGTAWTVIQRRYNGSINFYRNWADYKRGFGSSYGEYWIGNDILHQLTEYRSQRLKIVLSDFAGITKQADYSTFYVGNELLYYRLRINGYSGDAGDSMVQQNGMSFSTFDNDHDTTSYNCARRERGAWWYSSSCVYSNLNGLYLAGAHTSTGDGIEWPTWHQSQYSLKSTEMKIAKI